MSGTIANKVTEANDAQNIKEPHLGWMIGFMFLVSFVGLFALVPLRKVYASLSDSILPGHFAKRNFYDYQRGCMFSGYDSGLQTDLPKWYCDRLPHQWIPRTSGYRACKVGNMNSCRSSLSKIKHCY
jgi:hypothetical protein